MTNENVEYARTKVAAADLSAKQFRAVKLNTTLNQMVAVAASTDKPYGILQSTPVTNEAGCVVPIGLGGSSQMVAAEVIAVNAEVSFNSDGDAVAAAAGSYTLGTCEAGGNTNDTIQVLLNALTIKA